MKKKISCLFLSLIMLISVSVPVSAATHQSTGTYNGYHYILDGVRYDEYAYSTGAYAKHQYIFCYITAFVSDIESGEEYSTNRSASGYGDSSSGVTTPTIYPANNCAIDEIYTYLTISGTRVGAFWL